MLVETLADERRKAWGTAYDLLRLQGGPLPEHAVRAIGSRMLTGLREFHRAGMVHMDVKASNVALMTEDPSSAVIIDYGSWLPQGARCLCCFAARDVQHARVAFSAP